MSKNKVLEIVDRAETAREMSIEKGVQKFDA